MNNKTTVENPFCDTCGVALYDRWDYKGQRKDHFPDCPRRYEKLVIEKPLQNDQEETLKRNHQNLVRRFLGFMALSLFSVVAWVLLGPSKEFPWFLIVMGVYLLVWEVVYFKETADSDPESRSKHYFLLHTSVAATFNVVLFLLWYFNGTHQPWFFFVLGLSGIALTIHFTAVYLDLRQILLLPQIMLFVVINGMNVGIWYFNGQSEDRWFMWPLCIWGAVILIESAVFGIVKLFQTIQRKKMENLHSYHSTSKSRRANDAHNSNNTLTTNLLAPPVIETKFMSYGSVSANTSDSDMSVADLYHNPNYFSSFSTLVSNTGDRHASTPDLGRTRSASSASDKKRALTAMPKYWSSNRGQQLAPVEMKPAGQSHRSLNSQQLATASVQAVGGATRATGTTTPPPAGHVKHTAMPILITPEITTFVTPQAQQTTAWPIQRPKSEGDLATVTQSSSVYNIDVGGGDDAESAVTRLLIEHHNSTAYNSKFFNSANIV